VSTDHGPLRQPGDSAVVRPAPSGNPCPVPVEGASTSRCQQASSSRMGRINRCPRAQHASTASPSSARGSGARRPSQRSTSAKSSSSAPSLILTELRTGVQYIDAPGQIRPRWCSGTRHDVDVHPTGPVCRAQRPAQHFLACSGPRHQPKRIEHATGALRMSQAKIGCRRGKRAACSTARDNVASSSSGDERSRGAPDGRSASNRTWKVVHMVCVHEFHGEA
jgi:hypothetical protein